MEGMGGRRQFLTALAAACGLGPVIVWVARPRADDGAAAFPIRKSEPEWRAQLTDAQYDVLRGTDDAYPDFPKRISYLIDPDGVIRRSYEVTDVDAHADEVLADLAELQGAAA